MLPEDSGEALGIPDIQDRLTARGRGRGARDVELRNWLDARVDDGELQRLGRGSRGSPYRWFKVGGFSSTPQESDAGEESGEESGPSE
jgi:hypothetical protein